MNSVFDQFGQYFFIVLGIYCIIRGVMLLVTGKLYGREEESLRNFSENGIRKYKMLSVVMNIFAGVFLIIISIVRLLNLIDSNMLRIIGLAVVIIVVVIYVMVRNSCKNMK